MLKFTHHRSSVPDFLHRVAVVLIVTACIAAWTRRMSSPMRTIEKIPTCLRKIFCLSGVLSEQPKINASCHVPRRLLIKFILFLHPGTCTSYEKASCHPRKDIVERTHALARMLPAASHRRERAHARARPNLGPSSGNPLRPPRVSGPAFDGPRHARHASSPL